MLFADQLKCHRYANISGPFYQYHKQQLAKY